MQGKKSVSVQSLQHFWQVACGSRGHAQFFIYVPTWGVCSSSSSLSRLQFSRLMPVGPSPPGRKPSVLAGRSGAFIAAFPACLCRVHLPPPDGAPVKAIRPLSYILSPSPRLLFSSPLPSSPGCSPRTPSRPLAQSGATETVQP